MKKIEPFIFTLFKNREFIFSPGCTIYVDYHGKNKYNIEKSGAVLGVLKCVHSVYFLNRD